jgi:hypothetical protein
MKGQSLSYCKYFTKKEGEIQWKKIIIS